MKNFFVNLYAVFGIPIRKFHNGEFQEAVGELFTPDLAAPYLAVMLQASGRVTQVITKTLHCYGIIKTGGAAYILGPAVRKQPDEIELKELALETGISAEREPALRTYVSNIPLVSLTQFADILCLVNAVLNDGTEQPENILLGEAADLPLQEEEAPSSPEETALNNLSTEKQLLRLVAAGDLHNLRKVLMNTQFRQDFNIANNSLRNVHNILIVAATLTSRAAIAGGLAPAVAFDLSDTYIRTAETLHSPREIYVLMARMVLELTMRVGSCRVPPGVSASIAACMRWIQRNITQPISLADAAAYLRISSGYLSTRFKRETGTSVSAYIAAQKVEVAKHLLTSTSKTLAEISNYLSFSSQSYFQNVFKKETGRTPRQFRRESTTVLPKQET